jgi:hypothetical protein
MEQNLARGRLGCLLGFVCLSVCLIVCNDCDAVQNLLFNDRVRTSYVPGGEDEEDGDYTFKNSYSCLVDHLLSAPLQVELNSPVAHIHYPAAIDGANSSNTAEDALITLTTTAGVQYKARKVVVSASPHVINNKLITFTPSLPSEITDAYSWTLMNNITKVK